MSRLARLASAPALTIVLASGLVGAAWAEPAASPESQQGSCLGKAALRGDVFEEGSARLRMRSIALMIPCRSSPSGTSARSRSWAPSEPC